LNHVGQVTLEGAFGWNNGQAIIDIINGANGIVVDRYVISPSVMAGSQFTEGIIRVYNKGTRSARVFYSIGSSKSKVTFQIDNGIIFARVITNDSLAISTSGTDISSMSEKTF